MDIKIELITNKERTFYYSSWTNAYGLIIDGYGYTVEQCLADFSKRYNIIEGS